MRVTDANAGSSFFDIREGTLVVAAHNDNSGSLSSTGYKVAGGATLHLAVKDALGWGNKSLTVELQGSSENDVATLLNSDRITLEAALNLKGNTRVTTVEGTATPNGYDLYGTTISASGTNNVIEAALYERAASTISVAEDGTLELASGITVRSNSYPSGGVTRTGAGELIISGNTHLDYLLTLSGGKTTLTANNVELANVSIAEGASLSLAAGSNMTSTGISGDGTLNVDGNATFNIASGSTSTLSSVTGSGTITKTGTGTLVFSECDGTETYTLEVSAGTAQMVMSNTDSVEVTNGLSVASGATLELKLTGAEATYNGITGAGTVRKTGSADMLISDYTTGQSYTLKVDEGNARVVMVHEGSAAYTTVSNGFNVGSDGTLELDIEGGEMRFGNLAGSGTIVKTGSGTMYITDKDAGSNLFDIREGTLTVTEHNYGSAVTSKGFKVAGGATLYLATQDALGWNNQSLAVDLQGTDATNVATLRNSERLTLSASLNLLGNTLLATNEGTGQRGYDLFGTTISASGANNVIEAELYERKASTITVAAGGSLELAGGIIQRSSDDATPGGVTITGEGELLISGNTELVHLLTLQGGTTTLTAETTSLGDVSAEAAATLSLASNSSLTAANYANAGTLTIATDAVMSATSLSNSGSLSVNGSLSATTVTNSGTAEFNGMGISIGSLENQSGASLSYTDAIVGDVINAEGASMTLSGVLGFSGTVANSGELSFAEGSEIDLTYVMPGTEITLVSGAGTLTGWDALTFTVSGEAISERVGLSTEQPGTIIFNSAGIANALVWQGTESGVWDTTENHWYYRGNAVSFAMLDSVRFGEEYLLPETTTDPESVEAIDTEIPTINKNVELLSDVTIMDMEVLVDGYSFSGTGDIYAKGRLHIGGEGSLSFAEGVAVSAGSIDIVAGTDDHTTSFGDTVKADMLLLRDSETVGNKVTNTVIFNGNADFGALELTGTSFELKGTGTLNVSGELLVAGKGETVIANEVNAGSLHLASGEGSSLTFSGAVTADELRIEGCMHSGEDDCDHVGAPDVAYEFGSTLTVTGVADIHIDSSNVEGGGATLLTVKGAVNAGTLRMTGSAYKHFGETVTVAGDLTVGGVTQGEHSSALEGVATFAKAVSIGGDLIISGHSEAYFHDSISIANGGKIIINDGVFGFDKAQRGYTLPTIELQGQAAITIGPLTEATGTINANGLDFTVGGSARSFNMTLNDAKNLSVTGGKVSLASGSTQISGDISLSGGALLTLQRDNVLANAANSFKVTEAVLQLGSTQQDSAGAILLTGGTIKSNGGSLNITADSAALSYTGDFNHMDTSVALGSHSWTIRGVDAANTHANGNYLDIAGDVSGTGTLHFTGPGTTTLSSALSFAGTVVVDSGSVLVISNDNALAATTRLDVGSSGGTIGSSDVSIGVGEASQGTLAITHGGTGNSIGGDLYLASNARMTFTDLVGHEDNAALTLSGKMWFGGNYEVAFEESNGGSLTNLTTYHLVAAANGIDSVDKSISATATVYVGGEHLTADQYEFGYYVDENNIRHLTFTTLLGFTWKNAEGGEWHNTDNWHTLSGNSDALLLRQLTGEDGTVIDNIAITINSQAACPALYMDGSTNYSITSTLEEGTGIFNRADGTKPLLVKRGLGTMTWDSVEATVDKANIEQGTLSLTKGSVLSAEGTIAVSDQFFNASGVLDENGGSLSIDHSSQLRQGTATLTAYSELEAATLDGVNINGTSISGAGYNRSHIHNAAVDGFTLEQVNLVGTGILSNTTLCEGVTIGDATAHNDHTEGHTGTYTMGANVSVRNTITLSEGSTVIVNSDTVFDVAGLDFTREGDVDTYTLFTGGSYEGWSSLTAANVMVRDVNLGTLYNLSVSADADGVITVTTDGVNSPHWDTSWELILDSSPIVALLHNGGSGNTYIASPDDNTYRYDRRFSTDAPAGSDRTYVATLVAGKGDSNNTIIGAKPGMGTAEAPVDIWISDNGSTWGRIIGGAGHDTTTAVDDFYGNSHLQLSGNVTHKHPVAGGSQNVIQHGDSYLTISQGTYSSTQVIGGSLAAFSASAANAVHHGDSHLHLTGGTFGSVFGGSYLTWTEGDTHVQIEGGTVTNIYGGDFTTGSSTHTGNVTIDLLGGSVTNVYAAGGSYNDKNNANKVVGDITVSLYTNDDGSMAVSGLSKILGGNGSINGDGISTLVFAEAGTYNLSSVTVNNFDRFELAEGAYVTMNASRLNTGNEIRIGGSGTFEVSGERGEVSHKVIVESGVRLNIRTGRYGTNDFESNPLKHPTIVIENGATADFTGYPGNNQGMTIHLCLAGDGVDGLGALYKADHDNASYDASKVTFGYITLTDNASMGGQSAAASNLYIIPKGNTEYASVIDARNMDSTARGHVLTKQGTNNLNLFNTDIYGGTLNVVGGSVITHFSCSAGNTDVVLHEGTVLELAKDNAGFNPRPNSEGIPYTDDTELASFYDQGLGAAERNGLSIESLSGSGEVQLGNSGWLYIMMDQGYTDFEDSFVNPAEGQQFYNSAGFEYAHFSGTISSTGAGQVTMTGTGTQYFSGSESTYMGETHLTGGRLYLQASSTVSSFSKGNVVVEKGPVGIASLVWEKSSEDAEGNGSLWLDDGVRIYNGGKAEAGAMMTIGVEAHELEDGSIHYHEAQYSGVLSGEGAFEKVGGGTLIFDQANEFSGGGYIREGTLALCGWASLDEGTIAPAAGSSLMLSYDGSYQGEVTNAITNFALSGSGDARWKQDLNNSHGHEHTAALITNIGADKTLTLSGVISSATPEGGLLHAGEGYLVLAGANTYTGGTVITHGTVEVAHNSGLGATAEGGTATVGLHEGARLVIGRGTHSVLAAENSIHGNVTVGLAGSARDSSLTLENSGYYAAETELEARGALVFRGQAASNWEEGSSTLVGAGTLRGSGVVAVSDVSGSGTSASFATTDAAEGFSGTLLAEGNNTLLRIGSGAVNGNVSISGNGARVEMNDTDYVVAQGKTASLRSTSDAHGTAGNAAILSAKSVRVAEGGVFESRYSQTSWAYSDESVQRAVNNSTLLGLSMNEALRAYESTEEAVYHYATGLSESAAVYQRAFDETIALNTIAPSVVESASLTFDSGSTYSIDHANTSLSGGELVLNVDAQKKITLDVHLDPWKSDITETDPYSQSVQLVLFSGVGSFTATVDGISLFEDSAATIAGGSNQLYIARALDLFERTQYITDDTVVVYDAGAGVVYLDGILSVPEPTTTTLSLLALAALAARRRRS